jgi:VCBS repeat protein
LTGQTANTLSHTAHAKGNVVTGIVRVSDGVATTAAEASVTILDSPGYVSVPSPPSGVAYNGTVTFTAVASDYDGDDTSTKDFRLVYGPAGMSVHPDTGVVSWTARGPMFERTLRVNYGVGIDEPGAGVATGSFVVTKPNHVPPLARGAVTEPWAPLEVGDFDGDGDTEMLVATDAGIYELQKAAGTGFKQTWADFTIPGGNTVFGIAAEDVDGDHRAEIFATYDSPTIAQYSGVDRSLARRAELPVPSTYGCVDIEVADLDRNGKSEVICLAVDLTMGFLDATGVIVVLAADTLDVVAQIGPDVYQRFLAVANVDNDAALEIVTGSGHVFDGAAALLAPSSPPQWRYAPGFGWPMAVGDVDGNGIAEIIGVEGVDPIPGLNGTVRAFDARPGQQRQRWSFPSPNPAQLHVADITGDSIAEILVGHGLIGDVTAYRQSGPATTSKLFTVKFGDNSSIGVIATGNVDGDSNVEIIVAGGNEPYFFIAGGSPIPQIEWSPDNSLQPFGFLGGERLGAELAFLVATPDMRFARFNTANGDIALSGQVGTYSDLDAAFAVVDYDDDGVQEALLAIGDVNNVAVSAAAYNLGSNAVEWSAVGANGELGPADVAYADFTGDGHDELVVLTDEGSVRVYNVFANSLLYERLAAVGGASEVAAEDLDHDGMAEIVATIDSRVVVFSRTVTGFAITATSAQFVGLAAMEVTDIDGDGATDILVLYNDWRQPGTRLARLDRSLLLRGEATLGLAATDMTTERSSFARKNLVFWRSDFTSDLFAADPVSGAVVWRGPRFNGFIGPDSVRFHDLAGNGNWSISVGADPGVTLTR